MFVALPHYCLDCLRDNLHDTIADCQFTGMLKRNIAADTMLHTDATVRRWPLESSNESD